MLSTGNKYEYDIFRTKYFQICLKSTSKKLRRNNQKGKRVLNTYFKMDQ